MRFDTRLNLRFDYSKIFGCVLTTSRIISQSKRLLGTSDAPTDRSLRFNESIPHPLGSTKPIGGSLAGTNLNDPVVSNDDAVLKGGGAHRHVGEAEYKIAWFFDRPT
ncbi:MAG: hypothetical protein ACRYGP_12180 [Janthinobacterium lividum]